MGSGKNHGGVTYFRRVNRARVADFGRDHARYQRKSSLEHFIQANWLPVRVKKTRPKLESAPLFDSTKSGADLATGEL
jgi:hypothetical protein